MKAAILSTFPPVVCGIGQYAEQQAVSLEASGHQVERLNIAVELGDKSWGLGANRRFKELVGKLNACDKVYVHYQVSLYQDPSWRNPCFRYLVPHLLLTYLCLRFRSRIEIIMHESTYKLYRRVPGWIQWWIAALFFRAAPRLHFHTSHERASFARTFFAKKGATIGSPGVFYQRRSHLDKAQARRWLSLPPEERIFLCIGFFHPGKGFIEFARVFRKIHDRGILGESDHLYIVTSVRREDDLENRALLDSLVREVQGCRFIRVVDRYVGDEEFDHWIVASDVVVAPYVSGFTSSIAARAALYERPCILSAVGGLPEQASEKDRVYESPSDLERLLSGEIGAGRHPCT